MAAPQVVVAYDFSGIGWSVLERAVALACRAPDHVLHFLVAIDRHRGIAAVPPRDGIDADHADLVRERLAAELDGLFARHGGDGEVHFFVHARFGDPAGEILQLASEVGADLIVVGCHGLTGLERMMLGSTAERVVREARCAVEVVRPKRYPTVARVELRPPG